MNRSDYIKSLLTYHPPKSEQRKADHEKINQAAYDLAIAIDRYVSTINNTVRDSICRTLSLDALRSVDCVADSEYGYFKDIQQSRMFANQGITMDELNGKYDNKNK